MYGKVNFKSSRAAASGAEFSEVDRPHTGDLSTASRAAEASTYAGDATARRCLVRTTIISASATKPADT